MRPSIADQSLPRRMWLSALLGALMALGHAPFSLPWVSLLSLAAALPVLASAPTPRAGAQLGWALGTGYFLVTLHWIVDPFLVDAARDGWMAPFAMVFMSTGLALFWGAGAMAASWLATPASGRVGKIWALVLGLVLAETVRSFVLTGFPWGLIGSIWIETPLRMLGAWIGPFGQTLLTLVLAALLALALTAPGAPRKAAGLLACVALCGLLWLGSGRLIPDTSFPETPTIIRIIQPNEDQILKWDPVMVPVFWQRKLDLTATAAERTPDVVIWPEVTLPYLLGTRPDLDRRVAEAAHGKPAIVGAQRFDQDMRLLNALAVIDEAGNISQIYDKHHLVPFGEYIPLGWIADRLGLTGLATDALGGFSEGPGPRVLDLRGLGLGRVLPLICYEAIFPRYSRSHGEDRADWLLQITNDAWFGDFAGPQQHLEQARMRAIEQGLPLIRAANTGISAVIDPSGRLVDTLPLNQTGYIDVALPLPAPETLYARTGNLPVWVLLAGACAASFWRRRRFRD